VEIGERFAFQGRVFETADVDADRNLEIRATELALTEVARTFKRMVADEVIDLRVTYPSGETAVITGTQEHPFYVPAVATYVRLGELEPGAVLRTDSGGEAVVVDLTRHDGEFEVFNIEVAEAHNYFVRGAGFDGPGVLVHNKPVRVPKPEAKYLGSKKHGLGWKEGPATAKKTGKPQGQWGAEDLEQGGIEAATLEPGQGQFFKLQDSDSVVHMPDGTTQPAAGMWVRNNGTGTFHGYPVPEGHPGLKDLE
jgi:hypothetical protein